MANMSNYLANQLRDFYFRTQSSLTKPSTIAVCLTNHVPDATYLGNTSDELANAGGYVRQSITPSDSNFSIVTGASGQTYNNTLIEFPQATANWGWASGVIITDSATYGGGNVLAFGTLTNPRDIKNTDQYTIPASGLSINWS